MNFEDIALIIFGWFLGLFTPIIQTYITKNMRKEELGKRISMELKELQHKLVINSFNINQHLGLLDKDFLEWAKLNFENYDGIYNNESKRVIKTLKQALSFPDNEISLAAQQGKAGQCSLSLKKFNLHFLNSNLDDLTVFDGSVQNTLLEIKTQLGFINEEIEEASFYAKKTFDSSLSPENHEAVCSNMNNRYSDISKMSRRLADRIANFKML